jgi:hypothetical protein
MKGHQSKGLKVHTENTVMQRYSVPLLIEGLLVVAVAAGALSSPPQLNGRLSRDYKRDPRIAAVVDGLQLREERLEELSVTFDYETRPTADLHSRDGSRASAPFAEKSRATWARKGRKMLYDETYLQAAKHLPARMIFIFDGDKVLATRYEAADQAKPNLTVNDGRRGLSFVSVGAERLALTFRDQAVPNLISKAAHVRWLGSQQIGLDQCVGMEIRSDSPTQDHTRLWIDIGHRFLLRKLQEYRGGNLSLELTADDPHEWAPGLVLCHHAVVRLFAPNKREGTLLVTKTATVRGVVVGNLPDRLFDATPKPGQEAMDARTGQPYGQLPRHATERDLESLLGRGATLLTGRRVSDVDTSDATARGLLANDPECGPQCLWIVCRRLGIRATLNELCRSAHTNERGTSFQGLAEAARTKGLQALGVRMPFSSLRQLREPIIAVMRNHFYLVMGVDRGRAIIVSPPRRVMLIPEETLRHYWDGRALIVRQPASRS